MPEQCDELRAILSRSPFGPYRYLARGLGAALKDHWRRVFAESLRKPGGGALVAHDGTRIIGAVVCTRRSWESKVLDAPVAVLEHFIVDPTAPNQREAAVALLGNAEDWATAEGLACLMCKVYSDDAVSIHALERSGFLMMDTLLDLVYDAKADPLEHVPPPQLPSGADIRSAADADEDRLAALARVAFSGHFGRFNVDERIPKSTALNVYAQWIKSSLRGFADLVLVAEMDDRLVACSIWKNPSAAASEAGVRIADYSLTLVDPDYSGRGLFRALTYRGMQLYDGATDYLGGRTHVQLLSLQRAIAKLRWHPCGARHAFHRWIE